MLVDNPRMVLTGVKQIINRKQWLFGLLVACLLVFRTGDIVHDLDLAAHEADSDCEFCDLFFTADDGDAIVATSTTVYFAGPIIGPDASTVTTTVNRASAHRIRAPPSSI